MNEEMFENSNNTSQAEPVSEYNGEAVGEAEAKKPEASGILKRAKDVVKKRLALIITIPVAICCIVAIALVIFFNTPTVVAGRAVIGVFEDIASRPEFSTVVAAMQGGSIEASMTGLAIDGGKMNTDALISGKLYFDKNAFMLDEMEIRSDGFNLSGTIYADTKMLYVKEDEIFDEQFGIVVDEFGNEIEDSIFAYGSGSKYAFTDKDEYNMLVDAFNTSKLEDMQNDAKKLAEKYYTKIYNITTKYAEIKSKNDKIKVNGEKIDARIITIEIDEKAMSKIVRETCDYIINDKSVIDFLEKYEDRLAFSLSKSGMFDPNEDSLVDLYKDWLDELEAEVDDICESIEDEEKFKIKIKIATETMSSTLLKLSVDTNEETLFTIELGKGGIKKTDKITINIWDTEIVYTVEKNDGKEYSAKFEIDEVQLFEVEIDKKHEEFKFVYGTEKNSVTVEGEISTESKTTTISVDKITTSEYYYNYYSGPEYEIHTYEPELEIVIKESDKMPSIPKDYSTISDITEKDVDAWLEKFEEFN